MPRLPNANLGVDHLLRGQILEALARDQIVVVGRTQGDLRHLAQSYQRCPQVTERPEAGLPAIVAERRVRLVAARLRTDSRRPHRACKVEVQFHLRQPP
jgi:hypothetical protein